MSGASDGAGHHAIEIVAQFGQRRRGVANEREVMNGQHGGRARQGGGQDKIRLVEQAHAANQRLDGNEQSRPVPQAMQPIVGKWKAKSGE